MGNSINENTFPATTKLEYTVCKYNQGMKQIWTLKSVIKKFKY